MSENIIKLTSNIDDIKYSKAHCEKDNHQKIKDAIDFLKKNDCISDNIYKGLIKKYINEFVINIIKKDDLSENDKIKLIIEFDIPNITSEHIDNLIKEIFKIMLFIMKNYDSIAKEITSLVEKNKLIQNLNQKILLFHSVNTTLYKLKTNIILQNLEIKNKSTYSSIGMKIKLTEDIKSAEHDIDFNKNDEFIVIDIDMLENMFETFFVIENSSITNLKFGKTTFLSVIKTNISNKEINEFKKLKMKEHYSDLFFEIEWLTKNNISMEEIEFTLYENDYIKKNKESLTKKFYDYRSKFIDDISSIKYFEDQNIFNKNNSNKIKAYSLNNKIDNSRLLKLLDKISKNSQTTRVKYVKRFEILINKVNDKLELNIQEKQFFINILRMKCFNFMAINLLTEVYCNDILETVQLLHSKEKIYEKAISDIDIKNIISNEVKEEKHEICLKKLKREIEIEKKHNKKLLKDNSKLNNLLSSNKEKYNNQIKKEKEKYEILKQKFDNLSKKQKKLEKENYSVYNLNNDLIERNIINIKNIENKDNEIKRKDKELNISICNSLLYEIINRNINYNKYNINIENKLNENTKLLDLNNNREWLFINRLNCYLLEVFSTNEIIAMYIRGDIYLNTPIKNINWERNAGYINLIDTYLYNKLPQIQREEEKLYYEYK
jgi:hypothetical protein